MHRLREEEHFSSLVVDKAPSFSQKQKTAAEAESLLETMFQHQPGLLNGLLLKYQPPPGGLPLMWEAIHLPQFTLSLRVCREVHLGRERRCVTLHISPYHPAPLLL